MEFVTGRLQTYLRRIGEGLAECLICVATSHAAARYSRFVVRVPCVSNVCCIANSPPHWTPPKTSDEPILVHFRRLDLHLAKRHCP